MNILITGSRGQLGMELLSQLEGGGSVLGPLPEALKCARVTGIDKDEADMADLTALREWVVRAAPDVLINCAAYTNVDGCESDQEAAFRANALGARNAAILARESGAKLIHISTDYVFAGDGDRPVCEWDACRPQSVYGHTKYMGEQYVRDFCDRYFIVRTSWLYGLYGGNFVKTILRLAREKGAVRVVDDQRGNPTNAEDLAHHILRLAGTEEYGVYHATGNGICSWYEFACEFIRLSGHSCTVEPCTTEEFPRPARRPAYSALAHTMLRATVGDDMRPWQDAIASFMRHYNPESGDFT